MTTNKIKNLNGSHKLAVRKNDNFFSVYVHTINT